MAFLRWGSPLAARAGGCFAVAPVAALPLGWLAGPAWELVGSFLGLIAEWGSKNLLFLAGSGL